MPRPPRVHLSGVPYYVTQQGAHEQPLFRNEQDAAYYLELVQQYKQKHKFKLFCFTLLPEKIHLVIEPLEEITISEIMRDLTSRYSKYYNGCYGGNGPLFKGRFRTSMIEKETSLAEVIRFVHNQADIKSEAVSEGFRAMSSRTFLLRDEENLGSSEFIKPELEVLQAHFSQEEGAVERFASAMSCEELQLFEKRLTKPFIGSPRFVKHIEMEMTRSSAKDPAVSAPAVLGTAKAGGGIPFMARAAVLAAAVSAGTLMAVSGVDFFRGTTSKPLEIQAETSGREISGAEAIKAPVTSETAAEDPSAKSISVVLDGSSWDVKIIPMIKEEKQRIEYDQISFKENKVLSQQFLEKGFAPTSYNLTVNPDGVITWETMQRSTTGEVVFWRGEWNEGEMKGVLNRELTNGETRAFHFIGNLRQGSISK